MADILGILIAQDTDQTVLKFPAKVRDIYDYFPGAMLPKNPTEEALAYYGLFRVTEEVEPVYDPEQSTLQYDTPYQDSNGTWYVGWTTVPKPAPDVEARFNALKTQLRNYVYKLSRAKQGAGITIAGREIHQHLISLSRQYILLNRTDDPVTIMTPAGAVSLSSAQFQSIATTVAGYEVAIQAKAVALDNALTAITFVDYNSINQLSAVDLESGWPSRNF